MTETICYGIQTKIKGIEVEYEIQGLISPSMEQAAIRIVHAAMVRKAWTPIVTALQATREAPDELGELIALWAAAYSLGDRSKKLKTLAGKKAKAYVEEKVKEGRFSVSEARSSGLVAASVEEIFKKGDGEGFFEEALAELSPEDLLEPLAVTMGEVEELREQASVSAVKVEALDE